jgi:hypothetical protein
VTHGRGKGIIESRVSRVVVLNFLQHGAPSASVNGAGSGGGAAPAFFSISFIMSINILSWLRVIDAGGFVGDG